MEFLVTFFVTTIGSALLVGLALYLLRSLIITRLAQTVQHEFNTKLEILRADLQHKEGQISALRQTAISALKSRTVTLDKRRLEAIDQLWAGVIAMAPAKSASALMSVINFEKASKIAASDPRAREVFRIIPTQIEQIGKSASEAQKARPFVSPMAWALFSAYQAILFSATAKHKALTAGIDATNLLDTKAVKDLITTAMPDMASYIENAGAGAYHYLLDGLEQRLLAEMRQAIEGDNADAASLARAAKIIEQSEVIVDSLSKPKHEDGAY